MDPSLPQSSSRDPPPTGPQIRSRVTVVCAECKRLKLKCDRNAPCGSCKKRDTVARCIYSPAAAEKVDLHSLNNRLIQVEAFLSMFTAGQPLPAFHSTYPFASNFIGSSTQASGFSTQAISPPNLHTHRYHHHHAMSGTTESGGNDSIALSAHDVAWIWLEDLDLGLSWPSSSSSGHRQLTNVSSTGYIKAEPSPVDPGTSLAHLNYAENGNPTVIDVDNAHAHPTWHPSSRSPLTSRASSPFKRNSLSIDPRSECEVEYSNFPPQEMPYQPLQPSQRRRPSSAPIHLPALSIYYPVPSMPPPSMSSGFAYHRGLSGPIDSLASPSSSLNPYNFPPTTPLRTQQPSLSKPQVTVALLSLLPSRATCQHLLGRARGIVKVSPVVLGPVFSWGPSGDGCAGWSEFERRCLILLGGGGEWGECDGDREGGSRGRKKKERELSAKERERREMEKEKARQARKIYFAGLQHPPQQAVHHRQSRHQSPAHSQDSVMGDISIAGDPESGRKREQRKSKDGGSRPSLTFFAAMCAMLAIGASALEASLPSHSHSDHPDASHGTPSNSGATTPALPSSPSSSSRASVRTSSTSPAFFYALSQQALGVWDTHISSSMGNGESEDDREKERTDYILACILGVGYLMSRIRLESSTAEGLEGEKEKTEGTLYALVGKMVNVARTMGLGRDDHAPVTSRTPLDGRINQQELDREEWRKMLWWEVMFYDFFTADALGHPQYISATSYNTKLPACSESTFPLGSLSRRQRQSQENSPGGREEDRDDLESPSHSMDTTETADPTYHYLSTRYRFVQLAQTIKTRIAHPNCCCGYTFDQAGALETDVKRWESDALANLPLLHADYHTAADREQDANLPILQAQSCEHKLMANLLVLKVYSPFLRQAAGGSTSAASSLVSASSSTAAQASVGAAHAILRAVKSLHSITKAGTVVLPAMLDFYPLHKLLFDAIVVCAHASLTGKVPYPPSFGADESTLVEDVTSSVHILYEIGVEDPQTRAVVDVIHKRVISRGAEVSVGHPANLLKRKHDQVDMATEFEATASGDRSSTNGAPAGNSPVVMAPVFDLTNADQPQPSGLSDLTSASTTRSSFGNSPQDNLQPTEQQEQKAFASVTKAVTHSKEREKGKGKKQHAKKAPPVVGIRVRPGKDQLATARSRAQAASTQPLLTSTPRPLPTAENVLAFQRQQKQKLQEMSTASVSTTSSEAQSPVEASGNNRSRSTSFTHVQSEPHQHSQLADRIDGSSQSVEYSFGMPPIQETIGLHTIQRKQFGITELNLRQPQHLSSEPSSSFVSQMFNQGQSHPIYGRSQATYDEGKNTSPSLTTDGMGYSALSSPFSNAGPSPPASSSAFVPTSGGHPPTPTFGPRHLVPPTFGPQPPVAPPSTAPTTFIPQFSGTSYPTTSTTTSNFIGEIEMDHMPTTSLYDKSHLEQQTTMYDVKPPMENQTHHLFRQDQQQQQSHHQQSMGSPFYEVQDMPTHPHSLPMGMGTAPPWPPPNERQEQQPALSSQPYWGNGRNLGY